MPINHDRNLTLCLESGIAGGSIALFDGDLVVAGRVGEGNTSRAEALLPSVEGLLSNSGSTLRSIGRIAVSVGPGSFTGLRIGIASTLGLSRALECEVVGVPLLPAMLALGDGSQNAAAVVPIGKTDRAYLVGVNSVPAVVDMQKIHSALSSASSVVAPLDIVSELRDLACDLVDTGSNLAVMIGKGICSGFATTDLTPIYVQNPARTRGLY
ncbi:MAG: tRNA (adenosine(37)-N6)-threonylcarbamoyltransferase complex dimerization subunit type 1 TsaB [Acidobacteria bacterium]|nr:tRNA (adenosine(37)-N6)-threonylcarbamoyltransferase complex dimerization subunit type 1 TsaB [Acidobacteriota bacterium]